MPLRGPYGLTSPKYLFDIQIKIMSCYLHIQHSYLSYIQYNDMIIYKIRYVQQYNTSSSCSEACGNVTRPEGHGVWWGLCRCCQRGPAAPWLLRRHPRTVAMVVARATAHGVVLVSMVSCEVVWCWWGWLPSWSGLGEGSPVGAGACVALGTH